MSDLSNCPFCDSVMEPFGPDQFNHPRNGCWLSSVGVVRKEFAAWNRRAAPSSTVADDGRKGAAQTSAEPAETRMDTSSQPLLAVADDGLPPLPEPDVMYEDGRDQWGYTAYGHAHSDDQLRQAQRQAVAFVRAAWEAEAKLGETYKQIAWDAARQLATVDSEPDPKEHTLFGMPIVIDDTVPPGKAEFRSGRRTITVDIKVDAAPAGSEEPCN